MTDHLKLLVALLSHDGRSPDDPLTAPAVMSMLYRRGDEYLHTPPTRAVRPAA
jgi:hypothetical protein